MRISGAGIVSFLNINIMVSTEVFRKLLPIYAMGICTCAGAQNHADSYQIYGRANVTAYNISGYKGGQGAVSKLGSVGSRIGFRGEETITPEVRATFRIEGGVSMDTGTGDIASREASVGLRGKWGAVRLGYMLTPLDDLHSIAGPGYLTSVTNDNFSGFWANGYSNMFSNGGTVGCTQVAGNTNNNTFGFDNRYGNSIRYDSPVLRGFSAATHLALGELNKADGCKPYALSNKVQYEAAGLRAALAYNVHHELRGAGIDDSILMLALGYQVSPNYHIAGYWQKLRYNNPGAAALTQDGFGLRGRAFFGASTFEAGWYRAGRGKGNQTTTFSGISVGENTSANLYIFGYRYSLSKTTELWSQLAVLKNGSASSYDIGGGGPAGTAATLGASPRTIAVGIKKDF
jgi:predicted porin